MNDLNEVCEYSVFVIFSWDMLSIPSLAMTLQFQLVMQTYTFSYCFEFFLNFFLNAFQQWDEDAELFETMVLAMLTLWVLLFNLIICEAGQRMTDQFEVFGSEFDRCTWNNLPIGMQRMWLIFLSDTQQTKTVQSYGGIKYIRGTFKQVPPPQSIEAEAEVHR